MKILAFSDLHRDLDAAAALTERSANFDVVVAAGDFANQHDGLEEAIGPLREIKTPTILVPGNNETEEALRAACEDWEAATVLHGESAEIGGVEFFGLGAGVPTTPWDWSYDLTEEEAEERLRDCPEGAVLVVHSPPQGHCDQSSGGEHLGSHAILGRDRVEAAAAGGLRATSTRHGVSARRSGRPRSPTSVPAAPSSRSEELPCPTRRRS